MKTLLLSVMIASGLFAQDLKVDATWLHRYVPGLGDAAGDVSSGTCHYKPIFGEGDAEKRILRTVARFGQAALDARGNCQTVVYDRQEEIYFILEGQGVLSYGDQTFSMRTHDFAYLPPGIKHTIANNSEQTLHVLIMGFKIPGRAAIGAAASRPRIVNSDDVKEETVSGHPSSVLYKLLLGPRTGTRDAIDEAYVVTSLFWMDFAPGGTNFPHHHETAEEIYLVIEGEGEMVAGSGADGVEGRYPAKAGDAYYFRPNCTVGFYNQNKPGAKAHILAVRAQIPPGENAD